MRKVRYHGFIVHMSLADFRATVIIAPTDGVSPAVLLTVGGSKGCQVRVLSAPAASPLPRRLCILQDWTVLLGAQYLFNVPSGFSRLVLEHQCRPALGLRAAFVTGPHDAALVRRNRMTLHVYNCQFQLMLRRRLRKAASTRPSATPDGTSDSASLSCSSRSVNVAEARCIAGAMQGGLAGLLLRLRQDGHGQLAAYGPTGTAAHARALRHLIRWRHPALKVCDVEPLDPPVIYQVHTSRPAISKCVALCARSPDPFENYGHGADIN